MGDAIPNWICARAPHSGQRLTRLWGVSGQMLVMGKVQCGSECSYQGICSCISGSLWGREALFTALLKVKEMTLNAAFRSLRRVWGATFMGLTDIEDSWLPGLTD